uniref:Uncharacterized protein n=1 Tax=Aplanochytrium stocchinoi TaxID=215587 RepID=A0A7S3LIL2_9STRA|mmetsp:Transcript_5425/g.6866  ORF Transcript_5425/g.6866 Transcript_5425/m.6866 type:complete len:139 (+) Transcript_5425:290-706(+)|eukprot:CAMPEP_0204872914 /NCGR_PEP_ID=MMETSP1348-20121228/39276_1 /ASSEMBLY_ACC=CAM_ASM_000700 /TAXON_ID=215587 /ORGANISM="Aplanochytrium stocchinoi, Strain GSBS06" /LENGTH=138 /DNA_ID=CAMNT_0052027999 /DNA_START=145 /DNA_END=561 /DNA_ORIENTATION=+
MDDPNRKKTIENENVTEALAGLLSKTLSTINRLQREHENASDNQLQESSSSERVTNSVPRTNYETAGDQPEEYYRVRTVEDDVVSLEVLRTPRALLEMENLSIDRESKYQESKSDSEEDFSDNRCRRINTTRPKTFHK